MIVAKSVILEEKVEEFKKMSKIMIEESRKEDGNISYTLYQDIENLCCFTVIEFWKDKKSIDNHRITNHFTSIIPKINLLKSSSEICLYKEVKFE